MSLCYEFFLSGKMNNGFCILLTRLRVSMHSACLPACMWHMHPWLCQAGCMAEAVIKDYTTQILRGAHPRCSVVTGDLSIFKYLFINFFIFYILHTHDIPYTYHT